MMTIEIKHLAPTTRRGSRWKAIWGDHTKIVPHNYALNSEGNAVVVARKILARNGWSMETNPSVATLKDGRMVVFAHATPALSAHEKLELAKIAA